MHALSTSFVAGAETANLGGAGVRSLQSLFEQMPSVLFYTKDADLRFTGANAAMSALCGLCTEALHGRLGNDVFLPESSAAFASIEQEVLRLAQAAKSRLVQAAPLHGEPAWVLLSCWPVVEAGAEVAGIAAIAQTLPGAKRKDQCYRRVADASAYIANKLASPIRVHELAQRARVSISRLERDFMAVFGVPPNKYIATMRLEAAMQLLRGGGDSIAAIAHACGYADQSAFTRRFQAATRMTPSEFRRSCIRAAAKR